MAWRNQRNELDLNKADGHVVAVGRDSSPFGEGDGQRRATIKRERIREQSRAFLGFRDKNTLFEAVKRTARRQYKI
jgi:hypothetical protein